MKTLFFILKKILKKKNKNKKIKRRGERFKGYTDEIWNPAPHHKRNKNKTCIFFQPTIYQLRKFMKLILFFTTKPTAISPWKNIPHQKKFRRGSLRSPPPTEYATLRFAPTIVPVTFGPGSPLRSEKKNIPTKNHQKNIKKKCTKKNIFVQKNTKKNLKIYTAYKYQFEPGLTNCLFTFKKNVM